MKIRINKGTARGKVTAPPSKSMAHRLLICAGLSDGICSVHGISESEDVLATIDCLESIGAKCSVCGDTVTVEGVGKGVLASSPLKCRESGSTIRFFVPICLISGKKTRLTGSDGLLKRPMQVYRTICEEKNLYYAEDSDGITVKGPLKSGDFRLAGNISSQFISGLLFALPLLDSDSRIRITPPIESLSYIDMTIAALKTFGVSAVWQDENTLFIKGNQHYSAKEVYVEGDYSNAAFFEALNILGGEVEINGLSSDSIQGDRVYSKLFGQLKKGTPTIHISDCPDLGPILFSLAAAQNGGVFSGTKRLKIKESDRGEAMAEELRKFGVSVTVYDDEIVVYPTAFHKPDAELNGHNDHRIVMSEAVLLTLTGGVINGAQAAAKSFPDFFKKLSSLGIEVMEIEDNQKH